MPHIRILRHYIHTPYLLLSLAEMFIVAASAYLGYYTRFFEFPDFTEYLPASLSFGGSWFCAWLRWVCTNPACAKATRA